jgi:hypothetical protein
MIKRTSSQVFNCILTLYLTQCYIEVFGEKHANKSPGEIMKWLYNCPIEQQTP